MTGQSFLRELYQGRLRWDLVRPFPEPSEALQRATAAAIAKLRPLCPPGTTISRSSMDGLVLHGITKAELATTMGGLGLPPWGVFRMVCEAVAACPPAGLLVAAENAFGLPALLPQLPPGPTYDMVRRWLEKGVVSGLADTEPSGASNLDRYTSMRPGAGGYRIRGEKLYVSNAPVADVLIVSATLSGRRRLAIIDTRAPGVRITPQTFMGLEGFPIGRVVLDDVFVPPESVVPGGNAPDTRITPEAVAMVRTGKIYFVAAPCVALTRQLLEWAARFVSCRRIDGRPLSGFEEIERRLGAVAADCFAMEALADWALLTPHTVSGPDAWFERSAIKNATTALAWRSSERLLPVLGAEGYETASSKAARKADRPFAVEGILRDVLAFRIAGGVDFHVDDTFARNFILRNGSRPTGTHPPFCGPVDFQEHTMFLARQVSAFGGLRQDLLVGGDRDELERQQSRLIRLNRLATELLTAALVLARASAVHADLVHVYYIGCRRRLADLWRRVREDHDDRDSRATRRVVAGILETSCQK
jgi:alkylation response protein AidB-like acyl-CoA dehydrogenase